MGEFIVMSVDMKMCVWVFMVLIVIVFNLEKWRFLCVCVRIDCKIWLIDSRKWKVVILGIFKFWFYFEDDVVWRCEWDDIWFIVFFFVKMYRYVLVKVSKDKIGVCWWKEWEGLFNFFVKSLYKWFEFIGCFYW